jgi:hypothetical protein
MHIKMHDDTENAPERQLRSEVSALYEKPMVHIGRVKLAIDFLVYGHYREYYIGLCFSLRSNLSLWFSTLAEHARTSPIAPLPWKSVHAVIYASIGARR